MLPAALLYGTNWFDVVWVIALIFGLWSGQRTGLLGEIVRLLGWVLMVFLSVKCYVPVGDWLKKITGIDEELARLLAFVGIVIVVYIVSLFIRKLVYKWTHKSKRAAALENFGGMIAGALRMALVMTILTLWLSLTRSPFWHRHVSRESQIGAGIVRQFPAVAAVVEKQFPETFPFFRDLERPLERDEDETEVTSQPKKL